MPDLIDELCAQRLPEHLTASMREARRKQREALPAHDDERAQRREQDRQRLDEAARQLLSSAGWQRRVAVRSRNGLARYTLIICSARCRRHVTAAVAR